MIEGERVCMCVCVCVWWRFVCVRMRRSTYIMLVVPPLRSTCAVSTVEHIHTSILCTFYGDGAYACVCVHCELLHVIKIQLLKIFQCPFMVETVLFSSSSSRVPFFSCNSIANAVIAIHVLFYPSINSICVQ